VFRCSEAPLEFSRKETIPTTRKYREFIVQGFMFPVREDQDPRRIEMANTYRRRRRRETWHWWSNCSNWPTEDYVERDSKPTYGELCDQCEARQRNNNCR
jgi:hypothetical protein